MEGMIKLYDAHCIEIGETFARRARQLVKQQRAIWADDTHTAVQFIPDANEEWELPPEPARTAASPAPTLPHIDKESALYALATKRIADRRKLIMHTVILIPVYFMIAVFLDWSSGWRMTHMSYLVMGFAWGIWTTLYATRVRSYFKFYKSNFQFGGTETRRRLQLQAEIDRLKTMGFKD